MRKPTYKDVQDFVRKKYGCVVKTCWIAHAKEILGLPLRSAPNRRGKRVAPCPPDKLPMIRSAFEHFGLLT